MLLYRKRWLSWWRHWSVRSLLTKRLATILTCWYWNVCQIKLILPCPALPCPALPCPALPCPALPCPALPCPALPCPALPCPALPYPALPCPLVKKLWWISGDLARAFVYVMRAFVYVMRAACTLVRVLLDVDCSGTREPSSPLDRSSITGWGAEGEEADSRHARPHARPRPPADNLIRPAATTVMIIPTDQSSVLVPKQSKKSHARGSAAFERLNPARHVNYRRTSERFTSIDILPRFCQGRPNRAFAYINTSCFHRDPI